MVEANAQIEHLIEIRKSLQKTAYEQDLVDGSGGRVVYGFTLIDAMESDIGWGEDGDLPDKNIRHLFKA